MFIFKYDKKIDEEYWKHLVNIGSKFGHKFPTTFKITNDSIAVAEKKAIEYQKLWNKYERIFKKNISIIYGYDFPKNINFYVNTSPYSTFNVAKNYLSISILRKRNRFIPSVLHEANHFMFKKYYKNFCHSIGCTKDEVEEIKEFLTIINNDVFRPMQDNGWEVHKKYRKRALTIWKKTNDIKKVIKDAKKTLDEKSLNNK